jgi:hypothetical protein
MYRFVFFAFFSLCLAGCVLYRHDSTLKDVKPTAVSLSDFAGTYSDAANYHTPPNMLGLEGDETLGGAITGMYFNSDVQLVITNEGDILVKAQGKVGGPISIQYVKGRDFDFNEHEVVFSDHRQTGASEVAIGTVKTSMTWMLNDARNLVVIQRSSGGGLVGGVVPVISSGTTFSIFGRIQAPANQSTELAPGAVH